MLSNNFGISEEYDQQASNRDTDIHQNMCWSLCDSGSKLATERADEILFNCLKGDRIQVQHSTEEGEHMSLIVSRHIYGGILIAADARSTVKANGQFIVVTDAYEKIIPVGSFLVAGVGENNFRGKTLSEFVKETYCEYRPQTGTEAIYCFMKKARMYGNTGEFCVIDVNNGKEWISCRSAVRIHDMSDTTEWQEAMGEPVAMEMANQLKNELFVDIDDAVGIYARLYQKTEKILGGIYGTSPVGPLYSMYFIKDGRVQELVKEGKACR